jgi:hypothetical protein
VRARTLIAALAIGSSLIAATSAHGATTVGKTFTSITPCLQGQNTLETSTSPVMPAGVITSWQHEGAAVAPGNGGLLVARLVSGSTYLLVWVTPAVAFSPGANSFPTQIPVQAGDVIGLWPQTQINSCRELPPSGTTADQAPGSGPPPMWQNADFPNPGSGALNVSVVVEPDVDVDGFGDETQDSCPGTFGTNRGCPVSSGGGGGTGGSGGVGTTPTTSSGPVADQVAPSILSMAFVPDRFRVNSAGVARKAPRGSSLRVGISEPSVLVVFVERRTKGRRVGGRCLANTRIRRIAPLCTRYVLAGAFSRLLVSRQNRVSFAGRVLRNGVARNLAPGSYRATAYATDGAGNRTPRGRRATFTIVSS